MTREPTPAGAYLGPRRARLVRLPDRLDAELAAYAAERRMSANAAVTRAVELWLDSDDAWQYSPGE